MLRTHNLRSIPAANFTGTKRGRIARPRFMAFLTHAAALRRRVRSRCDYCTFKLTSSSTKSVMSVFADCVPVNLIVTVWPMYAFKFAVYCT